MGGQAVVSRRVALDYVPITIGLILAVLLLQMVWSLGSFVTLLVALALLALYSFRGAARVPGVIGLVLSVAMIYLRLGWSWPGSVLTIVLGLIVIWLATRAVSAGPVTHRRWLAALWALVGLQGGAIALDWGYTRQPCGWLDPLRVAAGCSRAVGFSESTSHIVLSADGTTTAGIDYEVAVSPRDTPEDVEKRRVAAPSTVDVRRISDGRRLTTLVHPAYVVDVALSPDGNLVATGSIDGVLRVWRVSDGALLHTIPVADRPVGLVSFGGDGQTVAAVSDNEKQALRSWRLSDGAALQQTMLPQETTDVVFSRDGRYLLPLIPLTNEVSIFAVGASEPLRTIKIGQVLDGGAALSPDGQLLVTGGQDVTPGVGDSVKVWRVQDGTLLHNIPLHHSTLGNVGDWVTGLSFSPDGTRFAASVTPVDSDGDAIIVWRANDGQLLGVVEGLPSITSSRRLEAAFQFSPDGRRLLVTRDGGIDSWPAP